MTVFFSEYFGVTLSLSFHPCTILILFYLLLLPQEKTGEAWEPPKMQNSFGNQEALDRKVRVISFFLSRRPLVEKSVFDIGLSNVRFVMNNVEKGKTSLPALRYPVSVSFYQCFVLIFIHMLTLSKGQKKIIFQKSGSTGLRNAFT